MKLTAFALTAALALGAGTATEAKVWDFSFTSSGGDVGSGQLVTTSTGPTYTVTGISGTIDGSPIVGLSPYAAADQLLYTAAASFFDVPGISFTALDGISYNLTDFPDGSNRITNSVYDPPGVGTPEPYSLVFSLTAIPESATWLMMLVGVAAIGGGLRLRRKPSEQAALR